MDADFVGAGSVDAGPVWTGFVGAGSVGACPMDAGSVGAGSVGAGSEPAPTGVTGMRDVIMMVPCTGFGMTTNASHITFGTWLGRSCQVHATI